MVPDHFIPNNGILFTEGAERIPDQERDRHVWSEPLLARRVQLPLCLPGVHEGQVLLL